MKILTTHFNIQNFDNYIAYRNEVIKDLKSEYEIFRSLKWDFEKTAVENLSGYGVKVELLEDLEAAENIFSRSWYQKDYSLLQRANLVDYTNAIMRAAVSQQRQAA